MSDAWIGIIGTLLGGILGTGGSYLAQRTQLKRERLARWDETRRMLFTDLLAALQAAHKFAERIAAESPKVRYKDRIHFIGSEEDQRVEGLIQSLVLIAREETIEAASNAAHQIYNLSTAGDTQSSWTAIEEANEALIKAMRQELGIE
jgi:hypothetical protein